MALQIRSIYFQKCLIIWKKKMRGEKNSFLMTDLLSSLGQVICRPPPVSH